MERECGNDVVRVQRAEAYLHRVKLLSSWSNTDIGGRRNVIHFLSPPQDELQTAVALTALQKETGDGDANTEKQGKEDDEVHPICVDKIFD